MEGWSSGGHDCVMLADNQGTTLCHEPFQVPVSPTSSQAQDNGSDTLQLDFKFSPEKQSHPMSSCPWFSIQACLSVMKIVGHLLVEGVLFLCSFASFT